MKSVFVWLLSYRNRGANVKRFTERLILLTHVVEVAVHTAATISVLVGTPPINVLRRTIAYPP